MLITTQNLTKKYGNKIAVNQLDLAIPQGALVAYLGTNGAGKSTTINMLVGLLKPTGGIISYAKDLKIGVVFQNSVLDDHLTVSVMVISGLIGVATFIFQTDLNYFVALIVHFIITVLLVAVMIVVNHWGITLQSLWLIVVAYVIIWIVLRFQQESDVREINAKLNKRK